ncbi:ankyrin repeat domain-containing protein [Agrobacterium vitis]
MTIHLFNNANRKSTITIKLFIHIAVLMALVGCSDSKQDDQYKNFSPEGRAIMENGNLSEEQKARLKLVEIDYAKAPPEMRAVAQKIFLGQVPMQTELKALGQNINKSYPDRKPNGLYRYGRTLLITAVENHNLGAVDALLKAGADAYISIDPDHETAQVRAWSFLYIATKQEGEQLPPPNDAYFDKTYANQLLELYLKNGGDPNYRWPDGETLLGRMVGDNFEGFKILLKAGADPWVVSRGDTPLAVQFVTTPTYGVPKIIHYLAEQGYYDKIPNVYIQDMIDAAIRELNSGIRTDQAERGKYYHQFEDYADAVKLVLQRSHNSLPKDSELYRLLYVDDGLYRQKKSEN